MLKHLKSTDEWNEKNLSAKGFTLIELLVVIVILGILAAVVVFAVGGVQSKSQVAACHTEARTVRTAQESYAAQNNGAYAPGGVGLTPGYLSNAPTLVIDGTTAGGPVALTWSATCTAAGLTNPAD